MILQIPLQPVTNQSLSVVINNQQCQIKVYTRIAPQSAIDVLVPLLVTDADGILTELSVDDDPDNLLLVTNPDPFGVEASENLYMDLYVQGVLVYQGMVMLYGSVINQYPSPLFNGFLFIDTANKKDPIYTDLGTNATLNWTDGNASTNT